MSIFLILIFFSPLYLDFTLKVTLQKEPSATYVSTAFVKEGGGHYITHVSALKNVVPYLKTPFNENYGYLYNYVNKFCICTLPYYDCL